jgi:hypothetical protein
VAMPDCLRILLWALLLWAALIFVASRAVRAEDCPEGAYGCGHAENHDQYRTWKQDDHKDADGITHRGMSCCDPQECRPTRAKQDANGDWWAWLGHRWAKVPRAAMLKTDILGDGRNHVCAPYNAEDLPTPPIYCFSPAEVKS